MRRRLRDDPTADDLARLYPQPHNHERWIDHQIRVDTMVAIGRYFVNSDSTIVDLSCGDGAIAQRIADTVPVGGRLRVILGDYAPGYEITGPIEITHEQVENADLWVCSETLEHLADPDKLLAALRPRTRWLLISTPDGERDDSNPEHVWAWDSDEIGDMLVTSGFVPKIHTRLDLRPAGYVYCYQIWICR